MKIKIWVLSTCIPDQPTPCWPDVFGSADAAQKAFDDAMRADESLNDRGDRAEWFQFEECEVES